jgi:hypothetical protein
MNTTTAHTPQLPPSPLSPPHLSGFFVRHCMTEIFAPQMVSAERVKHHQVALRHQNLALLSKE